MTPPDPRTAEERLRALATRLLYVRWGAVVYPVELAGPDGIVTEPSRDEWRAALAAEPVPVPEVDTARLRQAFLNAGLMWVIPPEEFEESVRVVAHEYDNLGVLAASLATPPEPKP